MTDTISPSNPRRRPNSPRAPGMSLRAAVGEVAKVYSRYSHGVFSKGELASALGMSAGSGSFLSKSAGLRDFGLIEETSGGEQVSELFKAIYQAPPGSGELKRAALAAIGRSSVFARLLQQFQSKVPDDAALALRLETQERFNRDRAQIVASAFRSSLTDYGLIDGAGNVLPVRDEIAVAPSDADLEQSSNALGIATEPGLFRVEIPLGPGRRAVALLPEDITAADARRIAAVLRAFAEGDDLT
jgi:hypothetical protein